jgi:hypothetical protein
MFLFSIAAIILILILCAFLYGIWNAFKEHCVSEFGYNPFSQVLLGGAIFACCMIMYGRYLRDTSVKFGGNPTMGVVVILIAVAIFAVIIVFNFKKLGFGLGFAATLLQIIVIPITIMIGVWGLACACLVAVLTALSSNDGWEDDHAKRYREDQERILEEEWEWHCSSVNQDSVYCEDRDKR